MLGRRGRRCSCPAQAAQYDEVVDGSRLGRLVRQSQQREATHPLPIYRVRELQRYSDSGEYATLRARGRPLGEGTGGGAAPVAPQPVVA